MGPQALAQVLRPLASLFDPARYPALLRGLDSPDDALVWKLDEERALVHTADFFPPVVDDPYDFGSIAAANSLSDVYAMGAEPIFAINLVGFPDDLDSGILADILRGGAEKVLEAGAVIAGGHTTVDREPKYGLAVTGIVHPKKLLTKAGARPADQLLLTKPIGTGVVTTAHKKGKVELEDLRAAVASMKRLSARASRILRQSGACRALTDVTGFGLLGHAHELAEQSSVAVRIEWEKVPLLPGAGRYAAKGYLTGGGARNQDFYGPFVRDARGLEGWQRQLLADPQTSGGLLAAVSPDQLDSILEEFERSEEPVWRIGVVLDGVAGALEIV
jgi:selenide,water dikinase